MKAFRSLLLIAVVLALAPAALATDFGIRAGRYDDRGTDFIGAEIVFDAGAINVNPNLEYSLEDDVTAGSANVDLTFDFGNIARVTPYVGAGIGIEYYDADLGNDSTDLLGNLLGGVQVDLGIVDPYFQVKYVRIIEDNDGERDSDMAFAIGLRF